MGALTDGFNKFVVYFSMVSYALPFIIAMISVVIFKYGP